ncbi:MAG: 30S ribosomal protein S20 [Pseudomonadota bacterium]|nr:30S ribosomal protein S20 [Pseudomonadota bacterium]
MANSPSAGKRARQAEKRRAHNQGRRSALRTAIKKVVRAVESKDQDAAATAYRSAVPLIDRMATKGIIHKNKAARHKRRLHMAISALGATGG